MLFSISAARRVSLAVLLAALTACANSPNGKNIEQILAADPRVQEKSGTATSDTPQQQPQASDPNISPPPTENAIASLPADFPTEIRYPNAQLQEVTPPTSQNNGDNTSSSANQPLRTRWVTSDPSNFVLDFYQKEFKANNWDLNQQSDAQAATIEARRNDLQVSVSIIPTGTNTQTDATPAPGQPEAGTEFIVQYQRNIPETAQSPSVPQTSNQPFPATDPRTTQNSSFTDLNSAPQELRQYITDLASLGLFQLEQTNSKSNTTEILTQFQPGKTISHREFARWLFAANNQIHANRPSQQIRAASPTAQPAFKDVPATDPDFPVIQGLAEAGLIPSSLSGDAASSVLFRPDAPLTREQLILWKVPLDTRQVLPNASIDAVRESWGFQDAARIDPKALRAVLADFQNGEQSNIRRALGYTTLFQPKRPVTRAEAAAAIWYFGNASEGISAAEALKLKQQQNQPQPQPSASPQPPVPSSSP